MRPHGPTSCFNEASVLHGEKHADSDGDTDALGGFNEASVLHGGKLATAARTTVADAASMRPPFFTEENLPDYARFIAKVELQ